MPAVELPSPRSPTSTPTRPPSSARWRRTPSRTHTTSATQHSERLSAPRGWEVIRLAPDPSTLGPTEDDLLALADAVREAARPVVIEEVTGQGVEVGRRGHLRVLKSTDA